MKPKLVALTFVIVAFATLKALRIHASPEHRNVSLLPLSIGSFRLMSSEMTRAGELVGTYRDGAATILLDVRPQTSGTLHNGAQCMLVVGEHPMKEDDREIRTADGTASFDIALFRSDAGIKLVASTECYAEGCAENPMMGFWHRSGGQPLVRLTNSLSVVPVSILIDGSGDDEGELVRKFEAFAAGLHLDDFRSYAAQAS
jgi:hypothetical protein